MPTIAELLAAKAATTGPRPASPPTGGAAASDSKKKPSLILRASDEPPTSPPPAFSPPPPRRSLSTTSGEAFSMLPEHPTPQDIAWHSLLDGLDTELCVIPDPNPNQPHPRAWISLRAHDRPHQPVLLFPLPLFPPPPHLT